MSARRIEELEARVTALTEELAELVRLAASDTRVDGIAARTRELERRAEILERELEPTEADRARHPSRGQ